MDLARPFLTQSLRHASYCMILIDNFSRFTTIYSPKCKGDATHYPKQFCEIFKNQTGHYPHAFRPDKGGEYINDVWDAYCINKGITHQTTTAYALESNCIPKCLNLTLAEMCRTLLADLPSSLWAPYTKNRLRQLALDGKTPNEILYKKLRSISHLHPFGTKCYICIPNYSKLDAGAEHSRLVGYTRTPSIFRVYLSHKCTVGTNRQVKFAPSSNNSTSLEVYISPEPTLLAAETIPTLQA
jgi:hypothetical protein